MSNLLNDPGAELGTPDWTLSGIAERTDVYPAHGGSWAWKLTATNLLGVESTSRIEQDALILTPGEEYELSAYVNPANKGIVTTLRGFYDAGDGSFVQVNNSSSGSDYEAWSVATFTAIGSTGRAAFYVPAPASEGAGFWLVDDVLLESTGEADVAAKIRTIKAAIATYLRTITTTAGYQVTIGDVHETEVGSESIGAKPAVEIIVIGEEKTLSDAAFSRKKGVATFLLQAWAEGDSAESTLWDLSSDFEKCLETPTTGSMLGLSYIDEVVVVSKDLFETPESVTRGLRMLGCVVQVSYTHARNAA